MIYHSRLPKENHNVTHSSPFKEFGQLLLGLLAIIGLVYWLMGFFVDVAVDFISPETEVALFDVLTKDLIAEQPLEKSSEVLQLEQATSTLLNALLACTDISLPVTLIYQPSDKANAFAVPGGKIVVLSGLLKQVQSENGLAFILAHELGHFKNRDHLRGMGRTVVLMAVSFMATGNGGLAKLFLPVNALQTAQFSQGRESDADATALEIIQCHYGHVSGASEFFERIADDEQSFSVSHYFDSHPEAKKRIATLKALREQKQYQQGQLTPAFWGIESPSTSQ